VSRMLRDEFGRRVRRSAYTRSATAIGLAIQADVASGYTLRDVFARNFGVWREAEDGRIMVCDVIFSRGTRLPGPGEPPISVGRHYHPVHNVGHFRYLEASDVDGEGRPQGDIATWDEIWFPFDPSLDPTCDLPKASVVPSDAAASQEIEEHYACSAAGTVAVTIRNVTGHYQREYTIGRWAPAAPAVLPAKRRRRR
jgi:hypothetical protein